MPGTQKPIAEVIDHINTPRGPKDRKATTGFWCVGIWNFSKNVDLANAFLRHFQPGNQDKWVEAGPTRHRDRADFAVWLPRQPSVLSLSSSQTF